MDRTELRDASILAVRAMQRAPHIDSNWPEAGEADLRRSAASLLRGRREAAAFVCRHAEHLFAGIALTPYLLPSGGPFGPSWRGHPFASPAMGVGYKLREPDVTKELANLMGHSAGRRGRERAVSFLRVLADLTGRASLVEALAGNPQLVVVAEHTVRQPTRKTIKTFGAGVEQGNARLAGRSESSRRIDLLFEWAVGESGQRAVVVVEAKLGATVGASQLLPYRLEAQKRARGGPVAMILLTAQLDPAERRHRAWSAVRWGTLMRRWEILLADAGDDDPEFARVRAHVWRFLLRASGSL